jgi:hypothetical protein
MVNGPIHADLVNGVYRRCESLGYQPVIIRWLAIDDGTLLSGRPSDGVRWASKSLFKNLHISTFPGTIIGRPDQLSKELSDFENILRNTLFFDRRTAPSHGNNTPPGRPEG